MSKQDTITLKLTREEAELLISALLTRKDADHQYIAAGNVYTKREGLVEQVKRARAELPKLELLLQGVYAAKLGMPLERYQAALARAQKNPPADVISIHQGPASHEDSP